MSDSLTAVPTPPHADPDRGITRLEAFSDGVYAIAITLLILDIHVPHVDHGLAAALLAQWPAYLSYVISFVIIGIWWANHQAILDAIRHSDHALLLLNTLHLMFIAFVPFATALLSAYIQSPAEEENIAAVVYVGAQLCAGVAINILWRYAAREGLMHAAITPQIAARTTRTFDISFLA